MPMYSKDKILSNLNSLTLEELRMQVKTWGDAIQDAEKKKAEADLEINEGKYILGLLQKVLAEKVTIPWRKQILYCLDIGIENGILKTPAEVANCIAVNYSIETTREVKNLVAAALNSMYNSGIVNKIEIIGRRYFGLPKYFNEDRTTLRPKYLYFIENKKKQEFDPINA